MTSGRQTLANPWWFAVVAWIGVIAFSSTSAAGEGSEEAFTSIWSILVRYLHSAVRDYGIYGTIHFIADKGVHVTMFAVLAILLWKAIPQWHWKAVAIIVAGAFVGSGSEFLQRFFPDRDPAIRDVLINIGGTALGIGICILILRIHQRRIAHQRIDAAPVCDKVVE